MRTFTYLLATGVHLPEKDELFKLDNKRYRIQSIESSPTDNPLLLSVTVTLDPL